MSDTREVLSAQLLRHPVPEAARNLFAATAAFDRVPVSGIGLITAATAAKMVKRGVDNAVVAAANCADATWLDTLAKKDRRVAVREALSTNPHLPVDAARVLADWAITDENSTRPNVMAAVLKHLPADEAVTAYETICARSTTSAYSMAEVLVARLVETAATEQIVNVLGRTLDHVWEYPQAKLLAKIIVGDIDGFHPNVYADQVVLKSPAEFRWNVAVELLDLGRLNLAASWVVASSVCPVPRHSYRGFETAPSFSNRYSTYIEIEKAELTMEPECLELLVEALDIRVRRLLAAQPNLPEWVVAKLANDQFPVQNALLARMDLERARVVVPHAAKAFAAHDDMNGVRRVHAALKLDGVTRDDRLAFSAGVGQYVEPLLVDPKVELEPGEAASLLASLDDSDRARAERRCVAGWEKIGETARSEELMSNISYPMRYVGDFGHFGRAVVERLSDQLGDNVEAWDMVAALGTDFAGTLPEMISTCRALTA